MESDPNSPVEGQVQGNRIYLHLLTPLCMLLALGVKETAVTFPAALLLWELYSGGNLKSAWRKQWSSWLLLVAGAIFFLLHDGYLAQMENSAGLNNLQGNLATQTMAFASLLRQWLFPLWLNIDPDLPVLHDFAGILPQMGLLVICIILIIFNFTKRPWLSFALAWALLQLLPLALAVVAELSLWLKPQIFRLSMVSLLVFLASLTLMRNQDFHSELALWKATVQYSPDKARVHNNLGYAYMQAGRAEDARAASAAA